MTVLYWCAAGCGKKVKPHQTMFYSNKWVYKCEQCGQLYQKGGRNKVRKWASKT